MSPWALTEIFGYIKHRGQNLIKSLGLFGCCFPWDTPGLHFLDVAQHCCTDLSHHGSCHHHVHGVADSGESIVPWARWILQPPAMQRISNRDSSFSNSTEGTVASRD